MKCGNKICDSEDKIDFEFCGVLFCKKCFTLLIKNPFFKKAREVKNEKLSNY